MGLSSLQLETTNLAAGRRPTATAAYIDPTSFPAIGAGGYLLTRTMVARASIRLRIDPRYRSMFIVPDPAAGNLLTATYDINVEGTNMATAFDAGSAGATDLADLVTKFATALNADTNIGGAATPLGTATAYDYDGDGTLDSVWFAANPAASHAGEPYYGATATGSVSLTRYVDAVSVTAGLYKRGRISGASGLGPQQLTYLGAWGLERTPTVTVAGWDATIDVRDWEAGFLYLSAVNADASDIGTTATAYAYLFPCALEASE